MPTEQNRTAVRQIFDGINQNDLNVFDELIGAEYVNHAFQGIPPGPDGLRQAIHMFKSAFPSMEITVEDVIAEGDRVATRGRWRGRHEGEFNGIPATGKDVEVDYTDVWRMENGKAVENWVQMDMLGLMHQLGVMGEPESQG